MKSAFTGEGKATVLPSPGVLCTVGLSRKRARRTRVAARAVSIHVESAPAFLKRIFDGERVHFAGKCFDAVVGSRCEMDERDPKKPGDEVPPGTPQSGEAICRRCKGSGRVEDEACPDCGGSGKVVVLVGDA
jgi:hypothetical protein